MKAIIFTSLGAFSIIVNEVWVYSIILLTFVPDFEKTQKLKTQD